MQHRQWRAVVKLTRSSKINNILMNKSNPSQSCINFIPQICAFLCFNSTDMRFVVPGVGLQWTECWGLGSSSNSIRKSSQSWVTAETRWGQQCIASCLCQVEEQGSAGVFRSWRGHQPDLKLILFFMVLIQEHFDYTSYLILRKIVELFSHLLAAFHCDLSFHNTFISNDVKMMTWI